MGAPQRLFAAYVQAAHHLHVHYERAGQTCICFCSLDFNALLSSFSYDLGK